MEELINTITKLSRGNPGAVNFLMEIYTTDRMFFDLFVEEMENYGIKGSDLYVMWNDLCDRDLKKVARLLAKCPQEVLVEACSKQDYSGRALIAQYIQ